MRTKRDVVTEGAPTSPLGAIDIWAGETGINRYLVDPLAKTGLHCASKGVNIVRQYHGAKVYLIPHGISRGRMEFLDKKGWLLAILVKTDRLVEGHPQRPWNRERLDIKSIYQVLGLKAQLNITLEANPTLKKECIGILLAQ